MTAGPGEGPSSPPGRGFLALLAAVFLLLYGGTLAIQWSSLRRQAVADAEEKAREITALLLQDLGGEPGFARLGDPAEAPRADRLVRRVRARVLLFGLRNPKIYDVGGTILFAEDRELVGGNFAGRPEFLDALARGVSSRVLSPVEYEEIYGAPIDGPVVETYVRVGGGAGPPFVFETYQDFGPARSRMWHMALVSGGSQAVVVGAALAAAVVAYRRAHRLRVRVETLERLLPICSSCKRIRVEGEPDEWVTLEDYFRERDRVEFTHGLCRACLDENLASLRNRKARPRAQG